MADGTAFLFVFAMIGFAGNVAFITVAEVNQPAANSTQCIGPNYNLFGAVRDGAIVIATLEALTFFSPIAMAISACCIACSTICGGIMMAIFAFLLLIGYVGAIIADITMAVIGLVNVLSSEQQCREDQPNLYVLAIVFTAVTTGILIMKIIPCCIPNIRATAVATVVKRG